MNYPNELRRYQHIRLLFSYKQFSGSPIWITPDYRSDISGGYYCFSHVFPLLRQLCNMITAVLCFNQSLCSIHNLIDELSGELIVALSGDLIDDLIDVLSGELSGELSV